MQYADAKTSHVDFAVLGAGEKVHPVQGTVEGSDWRGVAAPERLGLGNLPGRDCGWIHRYAAAARGRAARRQWPSQRVQRHDLHNIRSTVISMLTLSFSESHCTADLIMTWQYCGANRQSRPACEIAVSLDK